MMRILQVVAAVLGLAALNLVGFLQIIPGELRSLVDAHFVVARFSDLMLDVVLSSLIARLIVSLIAAIKIRPDKTGTMGITRVVVNVLSKLLRKLAVLAKRRPLLVAALLFLFWFSLFQLGTLFFYRIVVILMLGGGVFVITVGIDPKENSKFNLRDMNPTVVLNAAVLAAGVTAFLLGLMSSTSQVFNYVELRSQETLKKGALIGSTTSGVFILEDYDWSKSLRTGRYSVVFVPFSSFEYIWTRPRAVQVFANG